MQGMHCHLAYPGCFSPTAGVLSEVTCAMDWKWLEPLHGSFIPNLHVHSGHSSEFSRSYCWPVLLYIRKSVNQLNKTFLDILRGGSWKKKIIRWPYSPHSPSSDDDGLHQNTHMWMLFKEKIK